MNYDASTFIWSGVIILWLVCGALTSYVAEQKGYSPYVWMLTGILCSVLGLLAAAGLPMAGSRERLSRDGRDRGEASNRSEGDSEIRELVKRLNKDS
jgi:hypothetical protein